MQLFLDPLLFAICRLRQGHLRLLLVPGGDGRSGANTTSEVMVSGAE